MQCKSRVSLDSMGRRVASICKIIMIKAYYHSALPPVPDSNHCIIHPHLKAHHFSNPILTSHLFSLESKTLKESHLYTPATLCPYPVFHLHGCRSPHGWLHCWLTGHATLRFCHGPYQALANAMPSPSQHPDQHVQSKQITQWGTQQWEQSLLRHSLCAAHSIPSCI